MLPIELENIILDYKLDLEFNEIVKKNKKKLLNELNICILKSEDSFQYIISLYKLCRISLN